MIFQELSNIPKYVRETTVAIGDEREVVEGTLEKVVNMS